MRQNARETIREWSLDLEAVESLGPGKLWRVYARHTLTQTWDTSEYGLRYMSGLLRAALPLLHLSPAQAAALVAKHLDNWPFRNLCRTLEIDRGR